MNVLDVVLLALIAISGLLSLRVGLIREVFALGGLVVGILGAVVLTRAFAPGLPDLLGSAVATQVAFFLAVFLALHIIVSLIGSIVSRVVRTIRLGSVDHLLGLLFGCIRGAILGLLLIIGLTFVLPEKHSLLVESRGVRLADHPMRVFSDLLPEEAREVLQERHDRIREWLSDSEELEKVKEKLPVGRGIPL